MSQIKFGTDGWRAVIGKTFTPGNVEKVIQAFADIYPKIPKTGKPVVIGYDRRARSKESAELSARILTGNGIKAILSKQFCPTPCVSWMTVHTNSSAGIMITASHNPPEWNGIKFKESYGGAASPEYIAPIEEQITRVTEIKKGPLDNKLLSYFDPKKEYLDCIKEFVDLEAINTANFKVLAEAMYGSASHFYPEFLKSNLTELHVADDPTFGGTQPEPIPPHINEAMKIMKDGNFDICLVNDGDADRIGAIDENGIFVNPHQIFSLILKHFVEDRGWRGRVIKSLTTTMMLNRLCKKYNIPLETTPVGFKYISPKLKEPGVLIGGEESGGIGIPKFVCERDGILCGLLLLEILAKSGKKMSEMVEDLQNEVGPVFYKREDLHLNDEIVSRARGKLETYEPSELAGKAVSEVSHLDGYRFQREDESWLLVRSSGTEPLLRVYAEARTPEEVESLLGIAKNLIGI